MAAALPCDRFLLELGVLWRRCFTVLYRGTETKIHIYIYILLRERDRYRQRGAKRDIEKEHLKRGTLSLKQLAHPMVL